MLKQHRTDVAPAAVGRRALGIAAAGTLFAPAVLSLRAAPAAAQSRTAFDLISAARAVSLFAAIIKNHDLASEFSAAGNYGFFVPVNAAVERVPALVVERFRRDKEYARQIVLNHITDYDEAITTFGQQGNQSEESQQVKTKAGYTLTLVTGNGPPRLGG